MVGGALGAMGRSLSNSGGHYSRKAQSDGIEKICELGEQPTAYSQRLTACSQNFGAYCVNLHRLSTFADGVPGVDGTADECGIAQMDPVAIKTDVPEANGWEQDELRITIPVRVALWIEGIGMNI
jgi:hypothetical protein